MKIFKFIKIFVFIILFSVVAIGGTNVARAQAATPTLEVGFNPMAPSGTAVYLRGTGIDANSRILISSPLSASSSSIVTPTAYTNTSITFNIPTSQGLGDRTVQIQQADTGALSNGVTLSICNSGGGCPMPPPPVVSSVAPYPSTIAAMGVMVPATLIIPGKQIVIGGTNFQSSVGGNAYYLFDDGLSIAASIGSIDSSGTPYLFVNIPTTMNPGSHTVRARLANGFLSNAFSFTVTADPTPVVTSFSPASVHIGDTVTVAGLNFAPNSQVTLDNGYTSQLASSVVVQSNTSLTFKYPSICSVAGDPNTLYFNVYVSSVGTDGVYRYGKSLTKLHALDDCPSSVGGAGGGGAIPTPAIVSLSATTAAIGDTLTITGSNFASNAYVCLVTPANSGSPSCPRANSITPKTTPSQTSLQFVIPNYGGMNSVYVVVANDGTPPRVSNSFPLSIVAVNPGAPTISSITSHGTSDGYMYDSQGKQIISAKIGDKIDVNGSKFNSNSKVLIDGKLVSTSVSSDTLLSFIIPADTWAGINSIQIFQADTGFLSSNSAKISTVPPIVITSVDPSAVKPGDTITVSGKNFTKKYWAILDPDQSTRSMAGIPAGCDMKKAECSLVSTDGGNTLSFVLAQSLGSGAALPAGTHTLRIEQIDRGYDSNTVSFTVTTPGTAGVPSPVVPPSSPNATSTPTCTGGQILVGIRCVTLGPGSVTSSNNSSQPGTSSGKYNFGDVTLYRGSRGEAAKELQRFLNANLNLNLVIDGKIGPKTDAIIKQWQKDHGLKVDGRVGPKTKAMMNAEAK